MHISQFLWYYKVRKVEGSTKVYMYKNCIFFYSINVFSVVHHLSDRTIHYHALNPGTQLIHTIPCYKYWLTWCPGSPKYVQYELVNPTGSIKLHMYDYRFIQVYVQCEACLVQYQTEFYKNDRIINYLVIPWTLSNPTSHSPNLSGPKLFRFANQYK